MFVNAIVSANFIDFQNVIFLFESFLGIFLGFLCRSFATFVEQGFYGLTKNFVA